MFCVCSVSKPTVGSGNIPQISDSDSNSLPTKRFSSRNRVPSEPPKPSVMQMQRIVGAGSFRDTEPLPLPGSDMRKTVMDLFLGQAMEGRVQKKMRETGEWLDANAESKITSSRKGILLFMVQWMLPIWTILFLIAFGAIELPFGNPFLDDLLM
ncbi:NAD(P)H dehydrogenase subunit [Vigna angularis]|uniref:NAD(P)H dehydrogenase subunit n=2 Tax=Phaseolus angularis TaxID=3914 RepID=A0A8T0L0G8_PHAAN|nr:probable NAD(P)H dehydrogenase subunit CRR3, chloroplastic [Vigna angularis]KAG2405131.1 NAD(P)H dehydrogenase subunit [Vigna angularis]BAT84688.1 hypothetical protein VIGAN_04212500 [Vigna angularis var. angularis]